jgi:hypothetical protein
MNKRLLGPRRAFGGAFAILAVSLGVGVAASAASAAAPTVKLTAGLTPDKLGAHTTVSVGFQIAGSGDEQPSPLTEFNVRLPAGIGLAATTLGLDTCLNETLLLEGPESCPHDALMGDGSALAHAYLGSQLVSEPANLSIMMGKSVSEKTTMLYYFNGKIPVIAPVVFPSVLLSPGDSPISELRTVVPVIAGLPGTPDASIIEMKVKLGPPNLFYTRREGGKLVRYKPIGMSVPDHCPAGGFLFSADFHFQDGSSATASKSVPCPAPVPVKRTRKHAHAK